MILIRLILGLGLFISSLIAGWALGRRGVLTESRARTLLYVVVKYLAPVVLTLSFWRLQIRALGPWLLPLIGCLVSLSTLLPAWAYTRAAPLTGPQKGSVLTSAFFSNLGFFGAFVAFALRGEEAYGLAALYLIYFSPCFYSLGFALARRFGSGRQGIQLPDELRWYPFVGMAIGLTLNLLGIPRPALCESVNRALIPLDTVLYVVAIGSQLSLRLPRRWLGVSLAMSAIKFWWSPLVGWGLASAFGLEGLPRFIVLLQAAMPVGISPLMLSILFGLDRRLTNSLFVFTTLLAVPWLLVYLPWIR